MMYLRQMTRYEFEYAANQLAQVMSKPSKAHMVVTKHLLSQVPGRDNELCHHLQARGFKLTAFSDVNWDNPDDGKLTSFLSSISFEWPGQLRGGTARVDGAIDHGGRARGRRIDNKGSGVLLNDEGAGSLARASTTYPCTLTSPQFSSRQTRPTACK